MRYLIATLALLAGLMTAVNARPPICNTSCSPDGNGGTVCVTNCV